jgi:hypothetical protein
MAEENASKTTFICPSFIGLFELVIMTFGFEKCWRHLLEDYEFNLL